MFYHIFVIFCFLLSILYFIRTQFCCVHDYLWVHSACFVVVVICCKYTDHFCWPTIVCVGVPFKCAPIELVGGNGDCSDACKTLWDKWNLADLTTLQLGIQCRSDSLWQLVVISFFIFSIFFIHSFDARFVYALCAFDAHNRRFVLSWHGPTAKRYLPAGYSAVNI